MAEAGCIQAFNRLMSHNVKKIRLAVIQCASYFAVCSQKIQLIIEEGLVDALISRCKKDEKDFDIAMQALCVLVNTTLETTPA